MEEQTTSTEQQQWPKTTNTEDGGTKVEQENGEYVITYADGKRIEKGQDGIPVTYFPDGNIEFILPKSKKKCSIREGNGEHVIKARRGLKMDAANGGEQFTAAYMSQVVRIDDTYVIPGDWEKFKAQDYLAIEMYFSQINF